jgi:hypothetical protein
MREIRTLRATWRGLETWCGSGLPGHTGAPALDPTGLIHDREVDLPGLARVPLSARMVVRL